MLLGQFYSFLLGRKFIFCLTLVSVFNVQAGFDDALIDQGLETVEISSYVTDSQGIPLQGVRVELTDFGVTEKSDQRGYFKFLAIKSKKSYSIMFTKSNFIGLKANIFDVSKHNTFVLQKRESALERITVTPSAYGFLEQEINDSTYLNRKAIDRMPHIADDIFRLLPSLPGVSGGGLSASFNVRGGGADEVQVMLDGQQLYRPYHMKNFGNSFSIVDTESIGGMNFSSGGYSARYGNRMSGVMDMTSIEPESETKTSFSISLINSRVSQSGSFRDELGHYYLSLRKGYLGWILEAMDNDGDVIEPQYSDFFGKISYQLSEKSLFSVHLLISDDNDMTKSQGFGRDFKSHDQHLEGQYGSKYLWGRIETDWNVDLFSETIISIGEMTEERHGYRYDINELYFTVDDHRKLNFAELTQHWRYESNNNWLWFFGFNAKLMNVDYDYISEGYYWDGYNRNGTTDVTRLSANTDVAKLRSITGIGDSDINIIFSDGVKHQSRTLRLAPNGEDVGIYLANRVKLSEHLLLEAGLRWDLQTYYNVLSTQHQFSPRLNLSYQFRDNATLKFSWGQFYQAQPIASLQISDGVTEYSTPQRSEHWIIGLNLSLSENIKFRTELYTKRISNVASRYVNAHGGIVLFPESEGSRVLINADSAVVTGLELGMQYNISNSLFLSGNYTLSKVTDSIKGEKVVRSWDQTHALNAAVNYHTDSNWNYNIALNYHTGLPATGEYAFFDNNNEIERGLKERNTKRYNDFFTVDIRISKSMKLMNGELTVFFDATNSLNRENECCVKRNVLWRNSDGQLNVYQEKDYWLPLIPSVGIKWLF